MRVPERVPEQAPSKQEIFRISSEENCDFTTEANSLMMEMGELRNLIAHSRSQAEMEIAAHRPVPNGTALQVKFKKKKFIHQLPYNDITKNEF